MIRPNWEKTNHKVRFSDLHRGFALVLQDKYWLAKVLLGGFLLINPFLVALAPTFIQGLINPESKVAWVETVFPWILGFNVLSFWFPLGFTYEVLRRARYGNAPQLPDFNFRVLPRYAHEGAVKLIISCTTLLAPLIAWVLVCHFLFIQGLGLPESTLSVFIPPALVFVIPFCGVACCRWLDGDSVLSCALNYARTMTLFRRRWSDYLIAATFIVGLNSILGGLFYTLPFATVFGLCLVDTWIGPIYAESVDVESSLVDGTCDEEGLSPALPCRDKVSTC